MVLAWRSKDATEITHLKPGSPAYKSGLIHEGDEILALQWDDNEEVDVSDGSTEEVNAFISGDHGKSLTLTLKKSDGTVRKVTLQKEKSDLDDDNSKVRSFILKGEHSVGFISLPAFYTIGMEKKVVIMVVLTMLQKRLLN